jgi:hypothetical protein
MSPTFLHRLSSTRLLVPIVLPLVLALAACGGGLLDGADEPPSVSLAIGASSAAPGAVVRLAAAAVDDKGVDQVAFFRVETNGTNTQLGVDTTQPYELDTVVPANATGTLRYFARATDTTDQSTDSATVSLTVR